MLPYAAVCPTTQWFTSDGLLGNKFPPGVGSKALTVETRQLMQPPDYIVDAAILRNKTGLGVAADGRDHEDLVSPDDRARV